MEDFVEIRFAAGFGPIIRDKTAALSFYRDALGLPLQDDEYVATNDIEGVKHFGLWALEDAAESCFGQRQWPADLPEPQASIEFDVESADAVTAAAKELEAKGVRLLCGPREEPWGQTVLRFLSPEGLLIGVTYTPWLH
jgi:catechol 2,3-dioxygenase-like lactoylglutathione lyase family enzyme